MIIFIEKGQKMLVHDQVIDDYEMIEAIVCDACKEFLKLSFKSGRFENLYDMMFEEIRENLIKYLPENNYD